MIMKIKISLLLILFSVNAYAGSIKQCNQIAEVVNKKVPMNVDSETILKNAACEVTLDGFKLIYNNQISEKLENVTQSQLDTLIPKQKKYWCLDANGKALIDLYDIEYRYFSKKNLFIGKTYISKNDCDENYANNKNQKLNDEIGNNIEKERKLLAEERRKFEEEKRNREQARNNQRINLQVSNTQANAEGDFVINIQTGADTASLKINGEEYGGRVDGNYSIKKVARAGQEKNLPLLQKILTEIRIAK